RKLVLVEERENARQSGADVVVATRERAGRVQLEGPAPERLGVEVDRERDRALVPVVPHGALLSQHCCENQAVKELCRLGAGELLAAFAARTVSPVEVVAALAARIEEVDGLVGGFTTLCLERAQEEAAASEGAWARGEARPLEGIPFGVK